jgi:hypothetical protein
MMASSWISSDVSALLENEKETSSWRIRNKLHKHLWTATQPTAMKISCTSITVCPSPNSKHQLENTYKSSFAGEKVKQESGEKFTGRFTFEAYTKSEQKYIKR